MNQHEPIWARMHVQTGTYFTCKVCDYAHLFTNDFMESAHLKFDYLTLLKKAHDGET